MHHLNSFCFPCRFVLSEQMGVDEDMGYYRQGLVEFAPIQWSGEAVAAPESLRHVVQLVQYYLSNPSERNAIACRGRELIKSIRMSAMLKDPVRELEMRRAMRPRPVQHQLHLPRYAVILAGSPGAENRCVNDFSVLSTTTAPVVSSSCNCLYFLSQCYFLRPRRNMEVFEEVAVTLAEGIKELGRDAIVIRCRNLAEGCATRAVVGDRQVGTATSVFMLCLGFLFLVFARRRLWSDPMRCNSMAYLRRSEQQHSLCRLESSSLLIPVKFLSHLSAIRIRPS